MKSKVLQALSADGVWAPVESMAFTLHRPGMLAGKSTVNVFVVEVTAGLVSHVLPLAVLE